MSFSFSHSGAPHDVRFRVRHHADNYPVTDPGQHPDTDLHACTLEDAKSAAVAAINTIQGHGAHHVSVTVSGSSHAGSVSFSVTAEAIPAPDEQDDAIEQDDMLSSE